MFYIEARSYIEKLIRIRSHLNRSKTNIRSVAITGPNVSFLKQHLSAYKYASDELMASFFIRHRFKIKSLIPGTDRVKALHEQYELLLETAIDINKGTQQSFNYA